MNHLLRKVEKTCVSLVQTEGLGNAIGVPQRLRNLKTDSHAIHKHLLQKDLHHKHPDQLCRFPGSQAGVGDAANRNNSAD